MPQAIPFKGNTFNQLGTETGKYRNTEITESVSALGIHYRTTLAEEMVDGISVVHEVVLGSDTLRTR